MTTLIFQETNSDGYSSESEPNYAYKKRTLPKDLPMKGDDNIYMTAPIEDFLHWAKIEVKDIDVKRYIDEEGNPKKEFNRLAGSEGNTWEIYLPLDWCCIDIDVWTKYHPDFVRRLPFTISSSKKKHYYCRIDKDVFKFLDTKKPINVLDFPLTMEEQTQNKCERGFGDILKKMWEPKGGLMYFPPGMENFQHSFFKTSLTSLIPYMKIPQTTLKEEALTYDEKSSNDAADEKGGDAYGKLLNILGKDWFEPFDTWSKVMWCLPNEEKYREMFHAWSKQCQSKYSEHSVEASWKACKNRNPYGFQTLLKYCRIEDEKATNAICIQFKRNKRKEERKLVDEFTNTSVAKYFHQSHKFGFLFFRTWYELDKHSVWKEIDDKTPYKMRSDMYDFVSSKLTEYNVEVARDKELDEDERKRLHGLICNAKKMLGSTGFKNKVVEELETEYRDPSLLDKLNANRNLWAFNDCVIDLTTGVRRKIEASDYISVTCGYDYPTDVNETTKARAMSHLKPMFRSQADLTSALRQMASCLRGENWFEKLNIFQGTGGNGKGCFFDAMARVFENYWGTIPMEYWYNTTGKDAKSADIVGVNARYKRVLYSTEASGGEDETDKNAVKMNVEKVQKWSGRDEIECRDNFAKAKQVLKYVPYGTMVWNTNYIPEIPMKKKTESDALKRRLVVSEFPFNFVEKEEDIPLPREKVDDGFQVRKGEMVKVYKIGNPQVKADMKTDEMRNALVHILLDIYAIDINAKPRIELSDNTKKFTKGFMEAEKDSVKRFMDEAYEMGDGFGNINRSTIWDAYQMSDLFIEKMKALDFYKLVETLGYSLKVVKGTRVIGNIRSRNEMCENDGKPPM